MNLETEQIARRQAVGRKDMALAGGTNAFPDEIIAHLHGAGIGVPAEFAAIANAFRPFGATSPVAEPMRCPKVYERMVVTM